MANNTKTIDGYEFDYSDASDEALALAILTTPLQAICSPMHHALIAEFKTRGYRLAHIQH